LPSRYHKGIQHANYKKRDSHIKDIYKNPSTWSSKDHPWRSLDGLHPTLIDLKQLDLIRDSPIERLSQSDQLEQLICEAGLNSEGLDEFPTQLHPYCGKGLRIWQYPSQFAPYLIKLSQLKIHSYMELGIRHGGSYVFTTEFLSRFAPLTYSAAVDIIPCPSMATYEKWNQQSKFYCINTQHDDFKNLLKNLAPIDLTFIDSHHTEEQCRKEFETLYSFVNIIAFHDISNKKCPGVRAVWDELKTDSNFQCFEFKEQYSDHCSFMGIGLAIKKQRLSSVDI
jgi:hypothetical protein